MKSLVVGGVGRGGADLYALDITSLNESLDFDSLERIDVDEVTSWELIEGYSDPKNNDQASWDTNEQLLR